MRINTILFFFHFSNNLRIIFSIQVPCEASILRIHSVIWIGFLPCKKMIKIWLLSSFPSSTFAKQLPLGPFKYNVSGWGQKVAIFADLQNHLHMLMQVGGPKKSQKHADVILEWSLLQKTFSIHYLAHLIGHNFTFQCVNYAFNPVHNTTYLLPNSLT